MFREFKGIKIWLQVELQSELTTVIGMSHLHFYHCFHFCITDCTQTPQSIIPASSATNLGRPACHHSPGTGTYTMNAERHVKKTWVVTKSSPVYYCTRSIH